MVPVRTNRDKQKCASLVAGKHWLSVAGLRPSWSERPTYIRLFHHFLPPQPESISCTSHQSKSTQDLKWNTGRVLTLLSTPPDRIPQISPFLTSRSSPLQPHSSLLLKAHQPHAIHISRATRPLTPLPYLRRLARRTSLTQPISRPRGPSPFTSGPSSGSLPLPQSRWSSWQSSSLCTSP